jgi:hypothetical protein
MSLGGKKQEVLKMKFVVRDREAGNVIDEFKRYSEAEAAVIDFERDDEQKGIYEEDFYEIAVLPEEGDNMRCPVCGCEDHEAETVADGCCSQCGNIVWYTCCTCGRYIHIESEYVTKTKGGDTWEYCDDVCERGIEK